MKIDMRSTLMTDPAKWKEISNRLGNGQSVFIPLQPAHITALQSALTQLKPSDSDIAHAQTIAPRAFDVTKSAMLSYQSVQITTPFNSEDALKGGVVGGAVGALLGSLTNTAKNIHQPVLFGLSLMALGAVIYPEIVKKLQTSAVIIGPEGVTMKPPSLEK